MGKKLAIRGHSTRGKEVIELLEMMGGKNIHNLYGNNSFEYYVSGHAILNDRLSIIEDDDFVIFNLEEFLEKYPFKVGDKVYTKSNAEGTIIDIFWDGIEVLYQLSSANVNALGYFHRNELTPIEEYQTEQCEEMVKDNFVIKAPTRMNTEFDLTKYSYEVKDGKLVITEKNLVYPKTYAECCEVLNCCGDYFLTTYDNNGNPSIISNILISVNILTKLLICRDAYWKIYGEYMGLGKPWEPAVQNTISGITRSKDEVEKYSCRYGKTRLLEFPTIKMRDAFYENFKDLINNCKELL